MKYAAVLFALVLPLVCAAAASPPAFPGAEGFGAQASGGRGGAIVEVTNLEDSGPGSLRDAVSQPDRTVVFRVSGTINLTSRLEMTHPNITLAGQTAPGGGICLRGHELFIKNTENVIVRYLRSRPGDEAKVEHDALTIWNSMNVIVDHCSLSWSTDSLNDVVKGSGKVTVQWCILSEPLNLSVHSKGAHGYATGWDGRIIDGKGGGGSFHHNLIAQARSRAPRIGYFNQGRGLIDCRYNVIYNSGPAYGGETDDFNYVGNYYRPGPSDLRKHGELFEIWATDTRMYIAGNVYEGISKLTSDNAAGVTFKKSDAATCLVSRPFDVAPLATDTADQAFARVIETAGATLPARDAVDRRILDDVKNRTGVVINSQTDVGGWPDLKSAPPPPDSDHDGIPDAWEQAHHLNPTDPADARIRDADGYTRLEHYLNDELIRHD